MDEILPWHSDRQLDADIVRAVIRAQFPAVAAADVQYLHAGWDSEAYLVDGTWVFRFPKRQDVEAWLDREQAILPLLRPRLPLPIPAPCFSGEPREPFPYRFMGYPLLPGTPADRVAIDPRRDTDHAEALGGFLSDLHAFPAATARDCGLTESGDDTPERLIEEARTLAEWITPALPDLVRDRAQALLDGAVEPPPAYAGPPLLTHQDILAEHILIGAAGEIAGIIDFGDIALGDPAFDFVGLYIWRGEAFARLALDHYTGTVDARFVDRVAFMGWCFALIDLGRAAKFGLQPMDIALAGLATAFGT
jgi:aminoglycoside phosphotransferase (APT) family kinase protein